MTYISEPLIKLENATQCKASLLGPWSLFQLAVAVHGLDFIIFLTDIEIGFFSLNRLYYQTNEY